MLSKEDIAYKIIQESFSEILFSCPFLSSILTQFEYLAVENSDEITGAVGTDGKVLIYVPDTLIQLYKKDAKLVYRLFLHSILHTLLKHMFLKWYDPKTKDMFLYNMAMDVIVERIIDNINVPEFSDGKEKQRKDITMYLHNDFKSSCTFVRSMLDNIKDTQTLIDLFARDMHILWEENLKNMPSNNGDDSSKEKDDDEDEGENQNNDSYDGEDDKDKDKDENQNNDGLDSKDSDDKAKQGDNLSGQEQESDNSNTQSKKESKLNSQSGNGNKNSNKNNNSSNQTGDISGASKEECINLYSSPGVGNKISMNLGDVDVDMLDSAIMMVAMECKGQGGHVSSYLSNLLELTLAPTYNYKETLKKFMDYKEIMKVDIDSFDYIYYTFGLNKYNNIPLIEPLEYMDDRVVEDLVIAIDTSGSTYGELVKKFLTETYGVVEQLEIGNRKINIHILQCDTAIRSDVKITSKLEFDNYIRNFRVHGGGGTDFRPVFEHVDELCKKKEFKKLKGLIYFTDGEGSYPKKRRDYEVLFAIDDKQNNYDYKKVPPWAMYLRINDAMK